MKYLHVIAFIAVLGFAMGQTNTTTCGSNMWGPDCKSVCGYCNPMGQDAGRECNVDTGACDNGCADGWGGNGCTEPQCPNGCGPGICVAPNYCAACGDINYVSPDCHDIRPGGLLGSLIALIVISISITFCGVGSNMYKAKKSKHAAVSL